MLRTLLFRATLSSFFLVNFATADDAAASRDQAECWAKYLLKVGLCHLISTEQTYACIVADSLGFPAGASPTRAQCEENPGYKCHSQAFTQLIFCLPMTITTRAGDIEITFTTKADD